MVVGVLLFLPVTASANAGTGLMWAGFLHLTIGNAIIGMVEGTLLARFFQLPSKRCLILMTIANYLSAWLGGMMVQWFSGKLSWNLYNARPLIWLLICVAYLLTIVIEWPLVAACFWRSSAWRKLSIKASFLIQTASYLVLFGWYWLASGTSLYGKVNVVPLSGIQMPADAVIYFIGKSDGKIHELEFPSGAIRVVECSPSTNRNDRLFFQIPFSNSPTATLCLRRDGARQMDYSIESTTLSVSSDGVAVEPDGYLNHNLWFNFGLAKNLGGTTNSVWKFQTGFWSAEGIRASHSDISQRFRVAWETPFSQWPARAAYHLPGDKVIFQFGYDQICVLDAPTRKLARLAEGYGPAVALKLSVVNP